MGRKTSRQAKGRMLAVTAIVLAAFDVLIWRNVLATDVPRLVLQESLARPSPVVITKDGPGDAVADATSVTEAVAPAPPLADGRQAERRHPGRVLGTSAVLAEAAARIVIPGIAVDAAIVEVTVAEDGTMDVPKRPFDAGWYALGPRPGEVGSAVIAGHTDGKYGGPAVFADLHKMKAGDRIEVLNGDGKRTAFVVRETRRFDAAAQAFEVFASNDGQAHLNLVTCVGAWDKRAKQYAERLVVFADKETE
jgi:LPXTG-site transpeptidase (sortase) family protein